MGYNVTIGNAVATSGYYTKEIFITIELVFSEDAPFYANDGWGKTNNSYSSNTSLHKFVRDCKLEKIFGEDSENVVNTGVYALTQEDLEHIKKAKEKWLDEHPNAVPRFDFSEEDAFLARLNLYEFWIEYAVTKCKNPAIEILGKEVEKMEHMNFDERAIEFLKELTELSNKYNVFIEVTEFPNLVNKEETESASGFQFEFDDEKYICHDIKGSWIKELDEEKRFTCEIPDQGDDILSKDKLKVVDLWATADDNSMYLHVYKSETEAQTNLEKDRKDGATQVIHGFGVINTETGFIHDDADDFHYTLDVAELELRLLISNGLGIADEEGVDVSTTDSDIEDVSDDGRTV